MTWKCNNSLCVQIERENKGVTQFRSCLKQPAESLMLFKNGLKTWDMEIRVLQDSVIWDQNGIKSKEAREDAVRDQDNWKNWETNAQWRNKKLL